jgi:hypothetical protein
MNCPLGIYDEYTCRHAGAVARGALDLGSASVNKKFNASDIAAVV